MDRLKYHRLDGWQARLAEWAESRIGSPFAWGETDCAVLCAEAFDLMTGSNYASEVHGAYATLPEALRYQRTTNNLWDGLRGAGCVTLASPLAAQAGDFLIARHKGLYCGHVCLGNLALSSTPEAGVALGETAALCARLGVRALRVG